MEYGLIGERLGHSYSKIIHEKIGDYDYQLCPLTKDAFVEFMEKRAFKGINVTIPYKQDVIPYLDVIDDKAKNIGAVNTIVHKDNKLYGYNTDYYGFLYTLNYNHIDIKDKKVIVLGTGGSSKTIVTTLKDLGAKDIILVKHRSTDGAITYDTCYQLHSDASIVVNTSPIGMYPNVDESPIDLTKFKKLDAVVDIIFNPLTTKFLQQGQELGIKTANGLLMLVVQAIYAAEYFHDTKYQEELIQSIYQYVLTVI